MIGEILNSCHVPSNGNSFPNIMHYATDIYEPNKE